MKQGRRFLPFVLIALLAVSSAAVGRVEAAPRKTAAASGAKKSYAFHQFTGTVTALDKSTLTVEKTGKNAKTMVFTKLDGMKTTGDLEKEARVTVFYRDESGHPVAHKVVVKTGPATASR